MGVTSSYLAEMRNIVGQPHSKCETTKKNNAATVREKAREQAETNHESGSWTVVWGSNRRVQCGGLAAGRPVRGHSQWRERRDNGGSSFFCARQGIRQNIKC